MSVPPICIKCEKEEDFWISMGNLNELMNYLENYKCKNCIEMKTQELIEKYIDKETGAIKEDSGKHPLNSKEDLFRLLKVWMHYNSNKSNPRIDGGKCGNQHQLIKLKQGGIKYYMNADTKYEGVRVFLDNKENDWLTIQNSKGNKNLITNRNNYSIEHLYLYREI